MKKPIFFLLGLALLLGVSCKKDDAADKPKADLLTNGKWKISASVATFSVLGTTQTLDIYALIEDCDLDNFFIFQSAGVLIADEGADRCDANEPQQVEGTWELTQNETHLKVTGTDLDFEGEIVELTASKLVIKYATEINGLPADTETEFTNF